MIRISIASLILFASVYFGILLAGGSGETIHRDAEEFAKRLEVTEPTSPSPASHTGFPSAPDPGNPEAEPNLGAPVELEKPGMIYRTKTIEMKLVNPPEPPLPPGSRIADPNDPPPEPPD